MTEVCLMGKSFNILGKNDYQCITQHTFTETIKLKWENRSWFLNLKKFNGLLIHQKVETIDSKNKLRFWADIDKCVHVCKYSKAFMISKGLSRVIIHTYV